MKTIPMRRSIRAKRGYPPPLCWLVPDGWIAAAPVGGAVEDCVWEMVGVDCPAVPADCDVVPADCDVVGADCEVLAADCVEADAELLVLVAVAVVVPMDVPVPVVVVPVDVAVAVAVLGAVPFALGVVVGVVGVVGGRGAPAGGGSIDVPEPVTSAPFLAASSTNEPASGVWTLRSAPRMSPPGWACMYPTAPGGGKTNPMPSARRSIR